MIYSQVSCKYINYFIRHIVILSNLDVLTGGLVIHLLMESDGVR